MTSRLTPRPAPARSFAQITLELVEAQHALDEAWSEWHPESVLSEASARWWRARQEYRAAILEPQEQAS